MIQVIGINRKFLEKVEFGKKYKQKIIEYISNYVVI